MHRPSAHAVMLAATLLAGTALAATKIAPPPPAATPAPSDADHIVAVVNGEVITQADVTARSRLFALSTGVATTAEDFSRLRPQVTRQLIDERLRLQEIQRRKIVVPDIDVANAIANIEQRNSMAPGGLQKQLAAQGVAPTTLIAQLRVQLGWTRVLRQELGPRARISQADVDEQQRILKSEEGQPQYHVAEIFVAAEDPSRSADARKFAETVIEQLHSGAQFGIMAAEFSQSQTALEGGDLGWVRPDQLDPQVAALIGQMPQGAVSNPIRVAGGFDIVALLGTRKVGLDPATVLSLRQAFFAFKEKLDPQAPTEQQRQALNSGKALSASAKSCDEVAAANKAQGEVRPTDPGQVRLDHLNPQMAQLLGALKPGEASRAIVTPEGVMVVMVCASEQKNLAAMTKEDIADQLLQERVELTSRQLQQDLRRQALIDQRSS